MGQAPAVGGRRAPVSPTPLYSRRRPPMRLPNTAHSSHPWRIHDLTPDFRLEDVWALPTPGGPDDLTRLVRQMTSGSGRFSGATRTLFALRWKLGALLGWDRPGSGIGARVQTLRDRLPHGSPRCPARTRLPGAPAHPRLPDGPRMGGGGGQPDRARGDAHRLGSGWVRWLPRSDGGSSEAERAVQPREDPHHRTTPRRES